MDMIPRVYDTERAVRMLGEDGQADFVMLNQMRVNPATGQPEVVNDLTSGRYNVRLNAGPSFKTAREQTATTLISLMQAAPMHQHLFLDLIIKNLDFKDSDKAAKRVAIAMGFEKDPDAPPPQPDPEQQLDMMNKQATLEGKLLLNEQRERDLVAEGGQVPQVPNPYGGQ